MTDFVLLNIFKYRPTGLSRISSENTKHNFLKEELGLHMFMWFCLRNIKKKTLQKSM